MPSRTLLLFCFTRDIIYKLFINSHARCHSCSTYVSVSPLARRRARMKLTEIKKARSSLRSALIFRIEIIPLSRLYFRKNFSRRRCLVSIISASRHRISDGKTATRFALFVDLSLFHSSSPLVLLRLLFSHSLSQFAFAGHGEIHVRAVLP